MPHNRGAVRLDTYLTRLLWAVAKKNGGELRIASVDLEDVPEKCALSTDWDTLTHEVVVRANSGASEMIVINTGEQWAKTVNPEANLQPSLAPQPQSRSSVPDDAAAAAMEQRLLQRAAERKRSREAEELSKVYRDG